MLPLQFFFASNSRAVLRILAPCATLSSQSTEAGLLRYSFSMLLEFFLFFSLMSGALELQG